MGNSSGRLAVTRKSDGKHTETGEPVEANDASTKPDEVVLDKENVEPSHLKVDEDQTLVKEHSANGHSSNGHVTKSDEEVHAINGTVNSTTPTTTENIETYPVEDATGTHNASTTSESKKSNPLKWLKKNISFKKEKRSKKKDTSTVEEPQNPEHPVEKETVAKPEHHVESIPKEDLLAATSQEIKIEESPVVELSVINLQDLPHQEASTVQEASPNMEPVETQNQHPHSEHNGHTETIPEVVVIIPTITTTACEEQEPVKKVSAETPEFHEAICNGD